MSEERGKYTTGDNDTDDALEMLGKGYERADDNYQVRDEETPHDHYASIPNLIDDLELSVYAFRLYCHLKRVAGDSGKCWQSTTTLAKACIMSMGQISKAKTELSTSKPPLIRIRTLPKKDGRNYHEITITDIWALNHDNFTGKPLHVVKGVGAPSRSERYPSCGESKNIPLEEKPTTAPPSPDELAAANRKVDAILENERKAQERERSGASWSHREKIPEALHENLDAFVRLTGIKPMKSQVMDWIQTADEWLEGGITPADVKAAWLKANPTEGRGFTVTRPGSLTNTAAACAAARQRTSQTQETKRDPFETLYQYIDEREAQHAQ